MMTKPCFEPVLVVPTPKSLASQNVAAIAGLRVVWYFVCLLVALVWFGLVWYAFLFFIFILFCFALLCFVSLFLHCFVCFACVLWVSSWLASAIVWP